MGAILFGKLPAHGDFVSRGLSAPERDDFDRWLSADLIAARAVRRDAFDDRFDTAPPWRFAWDGADGRWTAGALAASVDASGRRYPLLLARTELRSDEVAGAAHACEDALYAALAKGWDADRVVEAVKGEPVAGVADAAVEEGWWLADGDGGALLRLPGPRPADLLLNVLNVSATVA